MKTSCCPSFLDYFIFLAALALKSARPVMNYKLFFFYIHVQQEKLYDCSYLAVACYLYLALSTPMFILYSPSRIFPSVSSVIIILTCELTVDSNTVQILCMVCVLY
jgi:hypothetical protein